VLSLFDAVDDVLVEPFLPDGAVIALDVGILLRLTGLDVCQGDAVRFSSIPVPD
jgi:hypothetical protein